MAFSKIILNGVTLMDVTQKTVDKYNLLYGETALGADGQSVVGTFVADDVLIPQDLADALAALNLSFVNGRLCTRVERDSE